jgi:hypothetical protein
MRPDHLTSTEQRHLGTLPKAIDSRRVRLYRRQGGAAGFLRNLVLFASRNRAVALGNHVFLPDACADDVAVLAHELTHCRQYQEWGPLRYFARGFADQLSHLLHRKFRIGRDPYRYNCEPGKPFEAYGMEQQGQIVEDCFRGVPEARALSPFSPGQSQES